MNIIGRRKIWYLISATTALAGVLAIILLKPRFGVDFIGGSVLEIRAAQPINQAAIQTALSQLALENLTIATTGQGSAIIKTKPINQEKKQQILQTLKDQLGEVGQGIVEERFETVGPSVSADLTRKAIIAVSLATLGIILYIAYAFRKVARPASPWRFGLTAIFAMFHDLLITIGLYMLVGHFLNFEVDSLFLTALLTVMGFSVHDTIVIFDRIRENLAKRLGATFEETVNESLVQTLARSINTSMTTILALLALFLLGGHSTQAFVLTILIGILVGTYSSIFTASPILVSWQNWNERHKNRKNLND